MRIVLIGAGNLATQLGTALAESEHKVVQVYSRTEESARALGTKLGVPYTTSLHDITGGSDVYIFSLKDSALEEVAKQVCLHDDNKVYLHTAGSMPMELFRPYASRYGVLYPMQTFSKQRMVDFKTIPLFVESNCIEAGMLIQRLADSLSHKVMVLSSEQRKYLHLAAVWACNFTNHCYTIAADILESHGIPFNVMLPLIDETTGKVHELKPIEAQTGPAIRYDKSIIDRQIELLDKDIIKQELYKQLSRSIHESSKQTGKSKEQL